MTKKQAYSQKLKKQTFIIYERNESNVQEKTLEKLEIIPTKEKNIRTTSDKPRGSTLFDAKFIIHLTELPFKKCRGCLKKTKCQNHTVLCEELRTKNVEFAVN